jgi:hypothetical protein
MISFDHKGLVIENMDFTTWVNYLKNELYAIQIEHFVSTLYSIKKPDNLGVGWFLQ